MGLLIPSLVLSVFWSNSAHADMDIDGRTTADAARAADAMVVGVVDSIAGHNGQIQARIHVDETLFGSTTDPLVVDADRREPGEARFFEGREVVLFIVQTDDGHSRVSGGETGQIWFETDEAQTVLRLADQYAEMRHADRPMPQSNAYRLSLMEVIESAPSDRRLLASALAELGAHTDGVDVDWVTQQAADPIAPAVVKAWAIDQLAQAEALEAAPLLAELSRDEHVTVRVAALEALAHLDAPEGIDAALAALDDYRPGVRQTAAHTLGRLGDESLADELVARIGFERDLRVRIALVSGLSRIASPAVLDSAIDTLEATPMRPLVREYLRSRL